jgi:adenosylmethionine-8-amino-7-oxononanoate aminotransferase
LWSAQTCLRFESGDMSRLKAIMTEWNTEALIEAISGSSGIRLPTCGMVRSEHEPVVLVEGRGALLRDSRGREYIDGNSSIWTNIHGHNHPHINAAIRRQLDQVAHTSFLGFTNPAAVELARAIVALFPGTPLNRVFFSDDGSTGIEVALRVADQYWQLRRSERHQFIAFRSGYHGDTAVQRSGRCGDVPNWIAAGTFLPYKFRISTRWRSCTAR